MPYRYEDPEQRRAYQREYMRRWRARRNDGGRGNGVLRTAFISLVLLVTTPLAAQGVGSAGSMDSGQPLCLAVLVDRSGSYEGIEAGRRLAGATIGQLSAGDSLLVRWISAESYHPKEVIVDQTLPAAPIAESENQFNRHARARSRAAQAVLQRAKRDALLVLARTPIEASSHTDIWGAIRAAQEWRDALACEEAVFVVISDLVHNRGVIPELRLNGVEIVVAGFEHGADIQETERVRRAFQERVEGAGGTVRFVPPGRVPTLRGLNR